jgi:hypothetical protein
MKIAMQAKQILFFHVAAALALTFSCSGKRFDEDSADGDGSGGQSLSGGASGTSGGTNAGGDTSGGGVGGAPALGAGGADMSWGGMAGGTSFEPLSVPEDVVIFRLDAAEAGLEIIASTLKQGAKGSEFYAALRKIGKGSACDASFTVEFFDRSERSMGAWVGAVYGQQLYWATDADAVIVCVDPGEVAMVAFVDQLPVVDIDEVGFIVYRSSYFERSVLPFETVALETLSVEEVQSIHSVAGTAFSGTLKNGLDFAFRDPSVVLFALTEEGRPLGIVNASEDVDIPTGGRWTFETSTVDVTAADAFPFVYGSVVQ